MAQEVRSSQSDAAQFDFSSQAGVMKILQAIRQSSISQAEKSELRDLVFSYANGGGDVAVKNILESRLLAAQIMPVASDTKPSSTPVAPVGPGFASSRPAPTFTTASESVMAATATANTPVTPASPVTNVPATPNPVPEVTQPPQVPETPHTPEPISPPTPTPPVAPQISPTIPNQTGGAPRTQPPTESKPASAAPQATAPIQPTTATPPTPPTPAPPAPPASPGVSQSNPVPAPTNPQSSAALDRIRQIKSEVNTRFGNPVNIVDINNAVGREYMSALLEAMKQVGSGSPILINEVMERLETAYAAVRTLEPNSLPNSAPPPTPPASSTPPVTPAPATPQNAPASQPASNQVSTQSSTAAPRSTTVPISPVTPVAPAPPVATEQVTPPVTSETPAAHESVDQDEDRWHSETPIMPDSTPVPIRKMDVGVPNAGRSTASPVADAVSPSTPATPNPAAVPPQPEPMAAPAPAPTPAPSPTPAPPIPPSPQAVDQHVSLREPLTSVAEGAEPLKTPSSLPDPSSLTTASVDGNPLYTKEVDNGLEQLLLDWPIFKKSGLFGTGPRGSQHPLFKKIAPLQIPLVLAGRFEGSTQEIKQSITDYMNGWRYEQGIIYEKGETFEQYLRRVIRHIIDWQKKKVGS